MKMVFSLKVILGFSIFVMIFSCQSESNEPNPFIEKKQQDMLIGKWQLDSSVYIQDEVNGIMTAPMLPTVWNFQETGNYSVENSVKMTGTFQHFDDSLFVVLMEVPNEYKILKLDQSSLQLRSKIYENDSSSMFTEVYLSRLKK